MWLSGNMKKKCLNYVLLIQKVMLLNIKTFTDLVK